jgi:hypothetical protein
MLYRQFETAICSRLKRNYDKFNIRSTGFSREADASLLLIAIGTLSQEK